MDEKKIASTISIGGGALKCGNSTLTFPFCVYTLRGELLRGSWTPTDHQSSQTHICGLLNLYIFIRIGKKWLSYEPYTRIWAYAQNLLDFSP